MRASVWLVWLLACAGDDTKPKDTAEPGDTDTDTDTDTDADTDTDTDADTDVVLGTSLRIVHASVGLADQDMVVNNNLPPVMQNLGWLESTRYSERPANTFTFQFKDAGTLLESAWIDFEYELLDQRRHTFVVYGPSETPDVLRLRDDDLSLEPLRVRIRWTHVAPALPATVDVLETNNNIVLAADLTYGSSVEFDHDPLTMSIGLDYDDDGNADVTFQEFQRSGGEYFHVMICNDGSSAPFLLGQTRGGETPIREAL